MKGGVWSAALFLAGCLSTEPLPASEVEPYAACRVDSDCAVELNGCCCDLAAVSEKAAADFRQNFACEHACACPKRPRACAVCEAGACVLVHAGTERCPDVRP